MGTTIGVSRKIASYVLLGKGQIEKVRKSGNLSIFAQPKKVIAAKTEMATFKKV